MLLRLVRIRFDGDDRALFRSSLANSVWEWLLVRPTKFGIKHVERLVGLNTISVRLCQFMQMFGCARVGCHGYHECERTVEQFPGPKQIRSATTHVPALVL